MAKSTTTYALSATWTKVLDAGDTGFLQAGEGGQVLRAFSASAPSGTVGHVLNPRDVMPMFAVIENVWLRALGSGFAYVTSDNVGSGSGSAGTTSQFNLTSAWVQVATAADTYVELDAVSGFPALWSLGSQPAAGSLGGHVLRPGDQWRDASNDAAYWVRSQSTSPAVTAQLIVSKG